MSASQISRWRKLASPPRPGKDAAIELAAPLAVIGLVTVGVVLLGDSVVTRMAISMLINLVVVVGLYTFIGTSGVLSFGHIAFMAFGAYVTALLTIPPTLKRVVLMDLPEPLANTDFAPIASSLVAAAGAMVVATVIAIPLMRLSGIAAGIATLAILQIAIVIARNWDTVAGASGSMLGVPTTTGLQSAFAWAVVAIVIAFVFRRSRPGLRLRASREDHNAALALGVNIWRDRVIAFSISAGIVAAAGAEYAHFLGAFSPDNFYLGITFLTLAMLVIGGMTSLLGAVVGTIVVSAFYEGLLRVEQVSNIRSLREIGLALVMIAVLVRRPHGITGGAEIDGNTLARWRDAFWAGAKAVRYRRARDLSSRDASRARQPR